MSGLVVTLMMEIRFETIYKKDALLYTSYNKDTKINFKDVVGYEIVQRKYTKSLNENKLYM